MFKILVQFKSTFHNEKHMFKLLLNQLNWMLVDCH